MLASANVFIAPRQAEGIGHAFLEAMAEGMVIVSNDAPTHSEYISHGLNGLLFSNRAALDIGLSSEMGNLAWQTMQHGRAEWHGQIPFLLQFLKETELPRDARPCDYDMLCRLVSAYRRAQSEYVSVLESGIPL